MIKKTIYVAEDGVEFNNEETCLLHEEEIKRKLIFERIKQNDELRNALLTIGDYCINKSCGTCSLFMKNGCIFKQFCPDYWVTQLGGKIE